MMFRILPEPELMPELPFVSNPNNPSPANPTILEFRLFYTYPQKTIIPYLERR
jgi:hypothetical protein